MVSSVGNLGVGVFINLSSLAISPLRGFAHFVTCFLQSYHPFWVAHSLGVMMLGLGGCYTSNLYWLKRFVVLSYISPSEGAHFVTCFLESYHPFWVAHSLGVMMLGLVGCYTSNLYWLKRFVVLSYITPSGFCTFCNLFSTIISPILGCTFAWRNDVWGSGMLYE